MLLSSVDHKHIYICITLTHSIKITFCMIHSPFNIICSKQCMLTQNQSCKICICYSNPDPFVCAKNTTSIFIYMFYIQFITSIIHRLNNLCYVTLVVLISWSQCLSLIAGFCSSPTALNDVNMFLTVPSNIMYVSQL